MVEIKEKEAEISIIFSLYGSTFTNAGIYDSYNATAS